MDNRRLSTVELILRYWGSDPPSHSEFQRVNSTHAVNCEGFEIELLDDTLRYVAGAYWSTIAVEFGPDGRPRPLWPSEWRWDPPYERQELSPTERTELQDRIASGLRFLADPS